MSESQIDIEKETVVEENHDSEDTQPHGETNENKGDLESKEFSASNPESKPAPYTEPETNVVNKIVTRPLLPQSRCSLPESEQPPPQSKVGECKLLPILVERLRCALESSCPVQNNEDQLPLEDSGVDSEEDLRLWASNEQNTSDQSVQEIKSKLDFKLLEDLLLSDINSALTRLQDTLKRIDIGTLTKYNSSLDSANKLNLLQLISNLLAKLKIPEEATVPVEKKPVHKRQRRTERHTIGVSSEELAQARKWLEKNGNQNLSNNYVCAVNQENVPDKEDKLKETFEAIEEKHIKDALNQQQSLQNKNKDTDNCEQEQVLSNGITKSGSKDDLDLLHCETIKVTPTYYNPSESASKHNKFMSRKAKIKRANTIDIPNYLKLQSDGYGKQNGCIALRRPIDISDKVSSNNINTTIPLFEPKTDNDRKFLALINKNCESTAPITSAPFKSFSCRQMSSVADKNWNNRFSNIKTAFDKPKGENPRQIVVECGKSKGDEVKGVLSGSIKLTYGSPKQKSNGFRHAPTSPFQKIEKSNKEETSSSCVKYGYLPKSSSSMLQDKVKMFDHRETTNVQPVPPPRTKGPKFNRENAAALKKVNRNLPDDVYNEKVKLRFSHSLDEDSKRKEMMQKRSSDSVYQNLKRNSLGNCSEIQKRFSHPPEYNIYPINLAEKTNIPHLSEYQCDKKSHPNRTKLFMDKESFPNKSYQKYHEPASRSNSLSKRYIENIHRKNDTRMKNVAVQTGNEMLLVTSRENINSDYHRQYPENEARTLCNNVSVQTLPDDTHNYSMSNFPSDVIVNNMNKTCVYYNKDLDYRRTNENYSTGESIHSPATTISSYHSVEDVPIHQQSHVPNIQSPKTCCQEYIYPGKLSLPKVYNECTPNQYDHYYSEPEKPNYISTEHTMHPITTNLASYPPTTTVYSSPSFQDRDYELQSPNMNMQDSAINMYPPILYPGSIEKKIENQDISSEGVVTRYTCAIGTVAPTSTNLPVDDSEPSVPYNIPPSVCVSYNESPKYQQKPVANPDSIREIQRHNMLQQNLIKKFQQERSRDNSPKFAHELSASPISPSFIFHPVESQKTKEKINLFEDKRSNSSKLHFQPVSIPKTKIYPAQPSKLVHPRFAEQRQSPIYQSVSPVDSSDEYLMSCATKPSRSIVLSKSESWHQLALSKGSLQVPSSGSFQKPPKPVSPSSVRFSKQFEASSSSENVKKMEEKIQQYFQGPGGTDTKVKKRQLNTKKNYHVLAKSQTMPHLCDEKLFDESADVDEAFDCLFKEATRSDERF